MSIDLATLDLPARYRARQLLGMGGMGVVVEALDTVLGTVVAVKLLRPDASPYDLLHRFVQEARVTARLRSPHVVRVFDAGITADGSPFLVMECLHGETLADAHKRSPLSTAKAIDVALQLCAALGEAHDTGLVHRDVKPSNVFLAQFPGGGTRAILLDFGVAFLHGQIDSPLNAAGTPKYMAPEQAARPDDVDHRADIWSVGVVLRRTLGVAVPGVRGRATLDHVPRELVAILDRCVAFDPDERWSDVYELAAALHPFGTGRVDAPLRTSAPFRISEYPEDPLPVSVPNPRSLRSVPAPAVPSSGPPGPTLASALAPLASAFASLRPRAADGPPPTLGPTKSAPPPLPSLSPPPVFLRGAPSLSFPPPAALPGAFGNPEALEAGPHSVRHDFAAPLSNGVRDAPTVVLRTGSTRGPARVAAAIAALTVLAVSVTMTIVLWPKHEKEPTPARPLSDSSRPIVSAASAKQIPVAPLVATHEIPENPRPLPNRQAGEVSSAAPSRLPGPAGASAPTGTTAPTAVPTSARLW